MRRASRPHIAISPHTPEGVIPLALRKGTRLSCERKPTEYEGWIWCTGVGGLEGAPGQEAWVPEAWVRIEGATCVLLRDYDSRELPLTAGDEVEVELIESGWAWVLTSAGARGWVPLECLEEVSRQPGCSAAGGARQEFRDRRSYGRVYHLLYDRALDASRSAVVKLVPEGASVLDIACGTGDLCFALRREKRCRVLGIDLSKRMLDFAAGRNPYDDVSFAMHDATDLSGFGRGVFDCATVALLLHEIPRAARAQALSEALRVAGRVVIADWIAPMPPSLEALTVRFIEWVGRHHYRSFRDYLARGGIEGVLEDLRDAEPQVVVAHRETLRRTCREIVVLSPGRV